MSILINDETFNNDDIHLSLQNQSGSVEHYFHFLLGFLIPLTLAQEDIKASSSDRKIYIRSCAIMDKHIESAKFHNVFILDKLLHKKLGLKEVAIQPDEVTLKSIEYPGYDSLPEYDYECFSTARLILVKQLSKDIRNITKELRMSEPYGISNVVLINREEPHKYYKSDKSEVKTAGNVRRSIPNFDDLHKELSLKYPDILSVTLEEKSLAYQITLFRRADIIVAQHGASLANLIWCTPKTTLIEILPYDINESCFEILATCMKINYIMVRQENKHSEVDINTVLASMPE